MNILLQAYVSQDSAEEFALISDTAYVAQNAARLLRALFEIALNRNWGPAAQVMLSLCQAVDRRMWPFEHVLKQFEIPYDIGEKLERTKPTIEQLREMDVSDVGVLIRNQKYAGVIKKYADQFPTLQLDAKIQPITRTVLRVTLDIVPDFNWVDRVHGGVMPWWIWCEDGEHAEILHSEQLMISKRQLGEPLTLSFTIPLPQTDTTVDELPPQIFIKAVSDHWIGAETTIPISFKHLILPHHNTTSHTDLLDLQPLPVSALQNPVLEDICSKRFQFFNPIQTQIFHTTYWTQENLLVGAPTGSGKTAIAEVAMWYVIFLFVHDT